MANWTAADVPDQSGRSVLITGANSGLGYATAAQLARRGAHVILAARDRSRGGEAMSRIKAEHPGADLELQLLDLTDLDSVRDLAGRLGASKLDVFVANAGVLQPPKSQTKQGFDLQFGVNYLAHFALTLLLLPLLEASPDGRVVTVTSGLHRGAKLDFDDLQNDRAYAPAAGYAQSMLAKVYFALELDRRMRARRSRVKSVLAHPGVAITNLTASMAPGVMRTVMNLTLPLVSQKADSAVWSVLYGATMPNVVGGQFFGPGGVNEMRGSPKLVQPSELAKDPSIAARLWDVSENLTNVHLS